MLRLRVRPALLALAILAVLGGGLAPAPAAAQKAAPRGAGAAAASPAAFRWLENVTSDRSMAWVRAQNAKTMAGLGSRPLFDTLQAATLAVLDSKDRLAEPTILGERIFNDWQDAAHPRGVWRSAWSTRTCEG